MGTSVGLFQMSLQDKRLVDDGPVSLQTNRISGKLSQQHKCVQVSKAVFQNHHSWTPLTVCSSNQVSSCQLKQELKALLTFRKDEADLKIAFHLTHHMFHKHLGRNSTGFKGVLCSACG